MNAGVQYNQSFAIRPYILGLLTLVTEGGGHFFPMLWVPS